MTPSKAVATALDPATFDLTALAAFADAGGAIRKLLQVAAVQTAALLLLLAAAIPTRHLPGHSPALDALLHEGAAGLVGAALLTSLTGTLACLLIVRGRRLTLNLSARLSQAEPAADANRPLKLKKFLRLSRSAVLADRR